MERDTSGLGGAGGVCHVRILSESVPLPILVHYGPPAALAFVPVDIAMTAGIVPLRATQVCIVLRRGGESEVLDVHAGLVPADMVHVHAVRNGSVGPDPEQAVRRVLPSVKANLAVTPTLGARPCVASRFGVYVNPHTVALHEVFSCDVHIGVPLLEGMRKPHRAGSYSCRGDSTPTRRAGTRDTDRTCKHRSLNAAAHQMAYPSRQSVPPRERRGLCRGLPRRVGVVVSRSFTWMRAHVSRVLWYGTARSGDQLRRAHGRGGALYG